ncbi:hypothetical protein T11_14553 [Trichinella zimbabwensis]|uniref:Uncharacterized protein n=1 Tax=Trichinella zimbabwensis TaxID=268475 RepID=A0A0V1GMG8_9BILA|nr:hypothetical protein T11_9987 [Trichinella zimbabwensis]KRY99640.1 hypothetical protein T11_14553 [Trichinella zimbabwensis]
MDIAFAFLTFAYALFSLCSIDSVFLFGLIVVVLPDLGFRLISLVINVQ